MYCIYILRSSKDSTRYVGVTEKSPATRVYEHNTGKGTYTRSHRPWVLVHSETYPEKSQALQREKFLKSGQGRKWLDEQQLK